MATVSLDIGNYVIISDNARGENYSYFAKLVSFEEDLEENQTWVKFQLLFNLREGAPVTDNQNKVLSTTQLSHIAQLRIFEPADGERILEDLTHEYQERNAPREPGIQEAVEAIRANPLPRATFVATSEEDEEDIMEDIEEDAESQRETLEVHYRNPQNESASFFEDKQYELSFSDGSIQTFTILAQNKPMEYFKVFDRFINENGFQIIKYIDPKLASTFLDMKIQHTREHSILNITPGECYRITNSQNQKFSEAMYITNHFFFVIEDNENSEFRKNDLVNLENVIDDYEFTKSDHHVENKEQLLRSINEGVGAMLSFGEPFQTYSKTAHKAQLVSQDFTDNWRKTIVYAVIVGIPFNKENILFETFPEKTILEKLAASEIHSESTVNA